MVNLIWSTLCLDHLHSIFICILGHLSCFLLLVFLITFEALALTFAFALLDSFITTHGSTWAYPKKEKKRGPLSHHIKTARYGAEWMIHTVRLGEAHCLLIQLAACWRKVGRSLAFSILLWRERTWQRLLAFSLPTMSPTRRDLDKLLPYEHIDWVQRIDLELNLLMIQLARKSGQRRGEESPSVR